MHVLRPWLSYVVASGASSTAATNNFTLGVTAIRLACTAACWVKIGPGTPTADKTTSIYLPANWPETFQVSGNNKEKIAVIQDSAGGTLSVTEMTQ